MTRMQVEGPAVELVTLAFAPKSGEPGDEQATLIQMLLVRNAGGAAAEGLDVTVASYSPADHVGGDFLEQARYGDRMRVRPLDDGWTLLTEHPHLFPVLRSPTFDLQPGEERTFVMVYEFATDGEPIGKGREAVAGLGVEKLLDETYQWWTQWHDLGLEVRTPDRKVDDLIEGLKGTLMVQVGLNGSVNVMSHYTGAWQRDVYPPVRIYSKFGYQDDAWRLADYMYAVASVLGGISNRLPSDVDVSGALPELDWLSFIPFEADRLRGEGPSYLPLMHTYAWRYGGGAKRLEERWEYLMHALRGQTVTQEGRMYFSGDETFRPPFGANIGLDHSYPFEHETWSAYSAFLFVAACEQLARAAIHEGLDHPDDIAWLQERAEFVREKTDSAYWLEEEERYSVFIPMDTGVPDQHCSPDVNTYPLFLGYQQREEGRSRQNILSCMDLILQDNGMLQNISGKTENIMEVDLGKGLYFPPGTLPCLRSTPLGAVR